MQATQSIKAGERTQDSLKTMLLRNSLTGLFYSLTGVAAAFCESEPSNATLVNPTMISQISLVWDMTYVEVITAPIHIVIETSPGYYMHQNLKRQTVSPDFARTYITVNGAKKALGRARRIWASAGVAMVDGNFNPIK